MPLVEDHGVTQWNRLLVVGLLGQQIEHTGCPLACLPEPVDAGLPVDHWLRRAIHACSLLRLDHDAVVDARVG